MSAKKLCLLADSIERGFITDEDRRGWATDLRGMAKDIERSVLRESPEATNAE